MTPGSAQWVRSIVLIRAGHFVAALPSIRSPIPDATLEPRIPDADRIWLSAGMSYRWSDSSDIKLTASRLFNLTREVALDPAQPGNALRGSLSGNTASYVNVIGLQVTFRSI